MSPDSLGEERKKKKKKTFQWHDANPLVMHDDTSVHVYEQILPAIMK